MTFEEKLLRQRIIDAIKQAGTIGSQDLYAALQARTEKQQHNIRNHIYRLVHKGIVQRPRRAVYQIIELIYRHYQSVLAYCHGKKIQYYALTFDDNDDSKEDELFDEIIKETMENCGNHQDTGYEITESDGEGMNSSNTYPEIEVDRL